MSIYLKLIIMHPIKVDDIFYMNGYRWVEWRCAVLWCDDDCGWVLHVSFSIVVVVASSACHPTLLTSPHKIV